jgi:CDP-diacylglycerol--serine O-phosphatidyltransferase
MQAMKNIFTPIIKQVPNTITMLNLASGFLAIILALDMSFVQFAPWLILLAAVFDFLDGFAARLLNAYSEIGKQLDSLADIVSFGVAPGILAFQLMKIALNCHSWEALFTGVNATQWAYMAVAVLIPVFSAIRLAKFNIDTRQTSSFIGLPTPASAILIASVAYVVLNTHNWTLINVLLNKNMLLFIIIADAILMVSNLKMFSFKIKSASFKDSWVQYLFLLSSVIVLAIYQFFGLPLVIALYIVFSVVYSLTQPKEINE